MSFKIRFPAVFLALVFSSVLVLAAGPVQVNTDAKPYSSMDLVLFGSLGVKFLSPSSR